LGGEHSTAGVQGLYIGIDADGLHLGGGQYQASTEQARRMRTANDDDRTGRELRSILDALLRKGFELAGEQLKRVPKPWDDTHPRADLLRYKSLTAHFHHPPDSLLSSPKLKAEVVTRWKALAPLNAWMAAHASG
ncbi:MAG: DUF2461 family protein, partial [Frankiaceae bacterium]